MRTKAPADEHALGKQIKKYLDGKKKTDKLFYTRNVVTPLTGNGIPDYTIIYHGYTFFLEIKHPTDLSTGPTENQVVRHEQIRRAGGYVLCSRTVGRLDVALDIILGTSMMNVQNAMEHRFGINGMEGMDEI